MSSTDVEAKEGCNLLFSALNVQPWHLLQFHQIRSTPALETSVKKMMKDDRRWNCFVIFTSTPAILLTKSFMNSVNRCVEVNTRFFIHVPIRYSGLMDAAFENQIGVWKIHRAAGSGGNQRFIEYSCRHTSKQFFSFPQDLVECAPSEKCEDSDTAENELKGSDSEDADAEKGESECKVSEEAESDSKDSDLENSASATSTNKSEDCDSDGSEKSDSDTSENESEDGDSESENTGSENSDSDTSKKKSEDDNSESADTKKSESECATSEDDASEDSKLTMKPKTKHQILEEMRVLCQGCMCGHQEFYEEYQEYCNDGSGVEDCDREACSLGDAFRCQGCPYQGLRSYKLGERLPDFELQLRRAVDLRDAKHTMAIPNYVCKNRHDVEVHVEA